MGALVVLAAALIMVAACVMGTAALRPARLKGPKGLKRLKGPQTPAWRLLHYAQDGQTVVAVARETLDGHVIEKHVVARIPDLDENWSDRFVAAKLDAEERAFHLNADSS